MRADLQRLKRDTDSSRNIPAADAHVSTGAAQPTHASGSSAVVTVAKQHKLELGITSAVVILLILAAAYGIYSFLSRTRPAPFQNFSVSKVTETGKATLVAISPDGKYLLHVMDDNGQQSLWLRNVPTNSNTQVVAPGPVVYMGVRFSPDGNYLYFVRSEAGNSALKYLYRAPVLGGTPQKLVTDIDSSISFSPDGTKFVYLLGNNPKVGEYRVIIHTLEGGAERTLATAPINEIVTDVAWSPDGKTIVTPVSQPGGQLSALAALDVESGKRNLFVISNDLYFTRPVWLPDGSGLLALAVHAFSNQPQIVFISFPSGKVSAVTRDTNAYTDLGVAADGRTVATIERQTHQNPYVVPDGGSAQAREFTIEGSPSDEISWTRDGQLLVTATDSGINLLNPASSAKTPMFSQFSYPDFAHACSDGRVIFMAATAKIEAHLWRAGADGGNAKELTSGKFDYQAVCSLDAKTVVYSDADNKLHKVGMEGGAPQQISEFAVFSRIAISPDGKIAAFVTSRPNDPKEKLVLQPLDSGQPPRFLDFERPRSEYGGNIEGAQIQFNRDGTGIIYCVRNGDTDNLWLQRLDGSPGKRLTDFKSEFIRDFDYSFDGKQLAVVRGHRESDVVLIRTQEK